MAANLPANPGTPAPFLAGAPFFGVGEKPAMALQGGDSDAAGL
jgi:hypothetical protein